MSNYLELLKKANELYANQQYTDALNIYRQLISYPNVQLDSVHLSIYFCLKNLNFFKNDSLKKIVVYTCNFGNYESIKEPVFQDPTIEYILFTDNKYLKSEKWKICVVDNVDTKLSLRRKSRLPKILAHKYLPEHDFSLYIDSSLQLKTADIRFLVLETLQENDIALYPHYKRSCVYDEINHVRASNNNDRQEDDSICNKAIQAYQDLGYPKNNGLFENAFIVRKNSEAIRNLNEVWWNYYVSDSERDQFTFMRALYTTKTLVNTITLGAEFRKSPIVNFVRHSVSVNGKKIAIVVHCFYLDVWENIYKRLEQFNTQQFDLFITGQSGILDIVRNQTKGKDNIFYLECENLGMDLLPFLKVVKHYRLDEYDSVLKLQTKNIKTLERKVQGDMIFDALINKDVFRFLDKYSASNHWSAIYPGLYARSLQALMYLNAKKVEQLTNILGLKFDENTTFSAGTMFWIKGEHLYPLIKSFYTIEKMFIDSQEQVTTGGDGSLAHALERVFGCLGNESEKLFSFRIGLNNPHYDIFNKSNFLTLFGDVQFSDSRRFIDAYHQLNVAKEIVSLQEFDEKFYLSNVRNYNSLMYDFAKKSPACHAILYNDLYNFDTSNDFSYLFYKLNNLDILRKNKSALVHYVQNGKKEGRLTFPDHQSIAEILDSFGLLSNCDQSIIHKRNKNSKEKLSVEKYRLVYPLLCKAMERYLNDERLSREIHLGIAHGVAIPTNSINFDYPVRNWVEKVALFYLLQGNYTKAFEFYDRFWTGLENKTFPKKSVGLKPTYAKINNKNRELFQNVDVNLNNLFKKINKKICVYTSLYGNRDELPSINCCFKDVDFICFSDRLHDNKDWKVVVVPSEYQDDNLNAKRFKVLPHKYLGEYDASLFVDANTFFYGNLEELIKCYLLSENFVMWKHPERDDVAWEVATIIAHRRHRPLEVINQLKAYVAKGMPSNTGIAEGSFIWRVHNNLMLNLFMEEWWEHIQTYSKRDQLSLSFLMWKNNFRPKTLPDYLGDGRENIYFSKFSHKDVLKKYSSISVNNVISAVVFVFNSKFKNSGSTVMRGFQLCDIIQQNLPKKLIGKLNISITDNYKNIQNSIIFATKGFMSTVTANDLLNLKNSGNIICADYVDAKVNQEHIDYIDVLVAASITAFIDYNTRFPHKMVHLLTHHVDPRIEQLRGTVEKPKNKVAYFGEKVNTKITDGALEYIDVYQVDTSGKDMMHTWIKQVPNYQYHYAVRNRRGIDGHKPFTKGFTAACVGAKLILERDVDDAMYYLGYHYPYFIDYNENNINETLEHILDKRTSNGIVDLELADRYIQSLRERSTPTFIVNEFIKMVSYFINIEG